MSVQIATTEARAALPSLIDRVGRGERITLTRHGRAVAVLVHPDQIAASDHLDLDRRVGVIDELMSHALGGTGDGGGDGVALSPERADDLVAELRAERDAR